MPELKVPLAHDQNGSIVDPDTASKGNSYYCPNCGDTLILRKGEKKIAHFAHKVTDKCSYETIIHKLAKQKLAEVVNAYIETKKDSPVIKRLCSVCDWLTPQTLPDRITSVSVEKKLKSGFIADVAIEVGEDIVAAIEVKVTHAVSDKKQSDIGVPFIELDGEAILENAKTWIPILDKLKPFECKRCDKAVDKHTKLMLSISKETAVPIPKSYYRTAFTECWHCHDLILVFDWPEREDYGQKAPKEPRPKTIQYRYSATVRSKYWANTCPYCKKLQGDWFLYSEPDSPFFAYNPMIDVYDGEVPVGYKRSSTDTIESYKADMRKLAVNYYLSRGLDI